jgi:hypothetical protein
VGRAGLRRWETVERRVGLCEQIGQAAEGIGRWESAFEAAKGLDAVAPRTEWRMTFRDEEAISYEGRIVVVTITWCVSVRRPTPRSARVRAGRPGRGGRLDMADSRAWSGPARAWDGESLKQKCSSQSRRRRLLSKSAPGHAGLARAFFHREYEREAIAGPDKVGVESEHPRLVSIRGNFEDAELRVWMLSEEARAESKYIFASAVERHDRSAVSTGQPILLAGTVSASAPDKLALFFGQLDLARASVSRMARADQQRRGTQPRRLRQSRVLPGDKSRGLRAPRESSAVSGSKPAPMSARERNHTVR